MTYRANSKNRKGQPGSLHLPLFYWLPKNEESKRKRISQDRHGVELLHGRFPRKLFVWQRAIQLSIAVYRLTAGFPKQEVYGLTNQMKRASVSIPSNIAEGYGRGSRGEYKQFLSVARGSNLELQTQLTIAKELQLVGPESINAVEKLTVEIDKMPNSLLKKL